MKWPVLLAAAAAALSSCHSAAIEPLPGVPLHLAQDRAERISNLRYSLRFSIPESPEDAVMGEVEITFQLDGAKSPLLLDFAAPAHFVQSVFVDDLPVEPRVEQEHIVIPSEVLHDGPLRVRVAFQADNTALNRRAEYLYTLFVPERARTAFPCFDQPDLKATYQLTLELPSAWTAVSNGPVEEESTSGDRVTLRFGETLPISTYLFAFAAGEFKVEEATRGDREMRFYHRESDEERLARNRDILFDLHSDALDWLEDYTGIPYPFGKFDFVLLPAFQFGGMEHPGAIYYGASRLLLEAAATRTDELARAQLIAHETAHMWFGDLVTMRWFDDVWTKEVYANFFAGKIANPAFPEIDHELAFYLTHYPAAYAIDRSSGTHPIRQPLDNLNDASSLYGAIIYEKAPIVMRMLEERLGEDALRDGIRRYLDRFTFGNASWNDLIVLLDDRYDGDLRAWSQIWVEDAGRPTIRAERLHAEDGTFAGVEFTQSDPRGRGRTWPQGGEVVLGYPGAERRASLALDRAEWTLPVEPGFPDPHFVLPDGSARTYALLLPDTADLSGLLNTLPGIENPNLRAVAWMTLWDNLLERRLSAERVLPTALNALSTESSDLLLDRLLADTRTLFWRFLSPEARERAAADLEETLWRLVRTGDRSSSMRTTALRSLVSIATTSEGVAGLTDLWAGRLTLPGLEIGEEDLSRLALELALRAGDGAPEILAQQENRITDPERKAEFEFVRQAVDPDPARRDSLFRVLLDPDTRPRETWALHALRLLHHPVRSEAALSQIPAALEVLPEIKASGSIFFPKRWLDNLLAGHGSPGAAALVQEFLDRSPELAPRLREKVVQSADMLYRAAESSN